MSPPASPAPPPVRGFAPLLGPDPRILVLGSMPSVASLAAGQYYAHPRNVFWRIWGEIGGFDSTLPYAERVARLTASGIAVWDVVASCVRSGSLDTAIAADTIVPNPIAALLAREHSIVRVVFNGAAAQAFFTRHVRAEIRREDLIFVRAPSTSPAHAGVTFAEKLACWRAVVAPALSPP
ncbi:MAG: DNA-deoxyinosine glycosylase [Gammaproteobacteria bacterium]